MAPAALPLASDGEANCRITAAVVCESSQISPEVGCSKPAIMRSTVVFVAAGGTEEGAEGAARDRERDVIDGAMAGVLLGEVAEL